MGKKRRSKNKDLRKEWRLMAMFKPRQFPLSPQNAYCPQNSRYAFMHIDLFDGVQVKALDGRQKEGWVSKRRIKGCTYRLYSVKSAFQNGLGH
jgi:hypothetical protein